MNIEIGGVNIVAQNAERGAIIDTLNARVDALCNQRNAAMNDLANAQAAVAQLQLANQQAAQALAAVNAELEKLRADKPAKRKR